MYSVIYSGYLDGVRYVVIYHVHIVKGLDGMCVLSIQHVHSRVILAHICCF